MEIDLEILKFLIEGEYFEDHSAALGIAKKILAESTIKNLSEKQNDVYQKEIEPFFSPRCVGVMGWDDHDTCNGDGIVDEDSLLISYLEDDMVCQTCRYDRDKIHS